MSTGFYGTILPAQITPNDVDIYYNYVSERNSDNVNESVFTKLDSNILSNVFYENQEDANDNLVEGLYNLKLPLEYFGQKGFYTVYIKPKEVKMVISDVGNLSGYENVRGIIIDSNMVTDEAMRSKLLNNGGAVGYRIVYYDDNGERLGYYRVITSNNRCEPIISTNATSNSKAYSYRYNDSASFVFLTVTPSLAPSFKSSATPFIGKPAQKIAMVNTMFEPVMLDIEMVDHDADTISNMLEGSQVRDLENGLITTFNENNQIYHQAEVFTLKENGRPIYEVSNKRTDNIDLTQTITDKI